MSGQGKRRDEEFLASLDDDQDGHVVSMEDGELQNPLLDDDVGKMPPMQSMTPKSKEDEAARSRMLLISFCLMVVIGLGNKIFGVLLYIPLYNYPLFVNLLTTFVYIPFSFAYIIPMIKYGSQITPESRDIPKRVWAIMGILDSLAGIMQSLAQNYLQHNGSLIILLQQAAIPVSMAISRVILKAKYSIYQYCGALIVGAGVVVVLSSSFSGTGRGDNNVPLWSAVLIASAIPMCLSSVYKEKALGNTEIDPVYLNGWVAVFQLLASLPLLIPSGYASTPVVEPGDLPSNLWNGMRCFGQRNSVMTGKHADDCFMAPIYTSIYIMFNLAYNILIILILKYGSSNILWLAMTVMVPLGNFAFALPFMPNQQSIEVTDVIGLLLIMAGLVVYRFWGVLKKRMFPLLARCFTSLGCLSIADKFHLEPEKSDSASADQSINTTEPSSPASAPMTPGGSLGSPGDANTTQLGGIGTPVMGLSHAHHAKKHEEQQRKGRSKKAGASRRQGNRT